MTTKTKPRPRVVRLPYQRTMPKQAPFRVSHHRIAMRGRYMTLRMYGD